MYINTFIDLISVLLRIDLRGCDIYTSRLRDVKFWGESYPRCQLIYSHTVLQVLLPFVRWSTFLDSPKKAELSVELRLRAVSPVGSCVTGGWPGNSP